MQEMASTRAALEPATISADIRMEWKKAYEESLRKIWEDKYKIKPHGTACSGESVAERSSTLDYIERRLVFGRSLACPDSQRRHSKQPK